MSGIRWDMLPPDLNVADFDVVIADLTPDDSDRVKIGGQRLPSLDQVTRLIFSSDGQLIIIGNPRTLLQYPGRGTVHFDDLLPFEIDIVTESGTELRPLESDFSWYFHYVTRWSYYANGTATPRNEGLAAVSRIHHNVQSMTIALNPLAETRFHKAISWTCTVTATVSKQSGAPTTSTPAVVLPIPTTATTAEVIAHLLRDRFGLGQLADIPAWDSQFALPREQQLRDERARITSTINELQQETAVLDSQLKGQATFHRLLFEQGDALEAVVLETFELLGATRQPVQQTNREDGRIVDPFGRSLAIEIKGRNGSAALSDVRQIDQWTRDALAEGNWEGRGLLVINPFRETAPTERPEPFPPNVVELARRFDIGLLLTTQLFAAVQELQNGTFDSAVWWSAVSTKAGLVL